MELHDGLFSLACAVPCKREKSRFPGRGVRAALGNVHGAAVVAALVMVLLTTSFSWAESGDGDPAPGEGIAVQRRVEIPRARREGMGRMTKLLLGADAAARALDAYSTVRMLRNRCNGDLSVPVCNDEMFLPNFVTRSKGMIYGYEGTAWLTQVFVVQRLSKHHPRIARFIPTFDMATTLPFAVNNLRLPVNPGSK